MTTFRSCPGGAVWGILPGRCFSRPDRTPTHPPASSVACHHFPYICDFVSSRCASQVMLLVHGFTGLLLSQVARGTCWAARSISRTKHGEHPHDRVLVEKGNQLQVRRSVRLLHSLRRSAYRLAALTRLRRLRRLLACLDARDRRAVDVPPVSLTDAWCAFMAPVCVRVGAFYVRFLSSWAKMDLSRDRAQPCRVQRKCLVHRCVYACVSNL